MLFCHPRESYTTATDIFQVVSNFFQENQLSWDSLVGVCTDGAPAMLGLQSGFITRVKEKIPSAIGTRCILHREALASRTLPAEMRDVMNLAIKVVNFIIAGALNSRLFKQLCVWIWILNIKPCFSTQTYDGFRRETCLDGFMNYDKKWQHF